MALKTLTGARAPVQMPSELADDLQVQANGYLDMFIATTAGSTTS
jgi:hypothetical protein